MPIDIHICGHVCTNMDENVAKVRDSVAHSSAEGSRPTERDKFLALKNDKKKKSKERFFLKRTIKDDVIKDVIRESQVRTKASSHDTTTLSIQEKMKVNSHSVSGSTSETSEESSTETVASPPEDRSAQLTEDPQSSQVPNSCHGEYAGIPALKKVRQSCTIS
ncbi:uncharacterized protein LOC106063090 isoform X2 [Biomphalaria glabrata]|uniref:Uncharacterized protein LOC106063090 isoform X2 n=1 Tax=Biomphalaria glabrata TaxID=6526 RepID=A0A9W3AR64_BIOGL|nr:uncharacterized protein LOC106063090 isoform X2 [Biomphalaria glabrata]